MRHTLLGRLGGVDLIIITTVPKDCFMGQGVGIGLSPKSVIAGWETEGEQRKRCNIFGALKDALMRVQSSCAPTSSLMTTLERSSQRSVEPDLEKAAIFYRYHAVYLTNSARQGHSYKGRLIGTCMRSVENFAPSMRADRQTNKQTHRLQYFARLPVAN